MALYVCTEPPLPTVCAEIQTQQVVVGVPVIVQQVNPQLPGSTAMQICAGAQRWPSPEPPSAATRHALGMLLTAGPGAYNAQITDAIAAATSQDDLVTRGLELAKCLSNNGDATTANALSNLIGRVAATDF